MRDLLFDVNKPRAFHEIPVDDLPVPVRAAFLALRKGDATWGDQIGAATVGDVTRLLAAVAEGAAERALDAKYEALLGATDRERATVALDRTVPLAESASFLQGYATGMAVMSRILARPLAQAQAETATLKAQLAAGAQLLATVAAALRTPPTS